MTDLPASAFDSQDCDWHGCDREAEREGRCRYHAGRQPLDRPGGAPRTHEDANGRVIPGALAHLMHDDDPLEDQVAEGRVHPGYLTPVEPENDPGTLPDADDEPEPEEAHVATRPPSKRKRRTRDTVIADIRAFHALHGRPPSFADDNGLANAGRRLFGSWVKALNAAGFNPSPSTPHRPPAAAPQQQEPTPPAPESPKRVGHGVARWTADTVVAAIRDWGAKHGRPPMQRDANGDPSLPSASVARSACGSWANAVEEAGFPRPQRGGAHLTAPAKASGSAPSSEEPKKEVAEVVPLAPPTPVAKPNGHHITNGDASLVDLAVLIETIDVEIARLKFARAEVAASIRERLDDT